MTEQELIALRLYRQHLTNPAPGEEICRDLNGIQAQFLSNSRHALAIRGCGGSEWNRGLVKAGPCGGRFTCFGRRICPCTSMRDVAMLCAPVIPLEADGWITRERKDYFAALILDTLTGGPATWEALRQTCRSKGLTDREEESVFQPWGGTIRALAEAGEDCPPGSGGEGLSPGASLYTDGGGGSLAGNTSPVFYILRPCQPAGRSLLPGSSSEGAETADAGLGP